jgi:hypothetical protein
MLRVRLLREFVSGVDELWNDTVADVLLSRVRAVQDVVARRIRGVAGKRDRVERDWILMVETDRVLVGAFQLTRFSTTDTYDRVQAGQPPGLAHESSAGSASLLVAAADDRRIGWIEQVGLKVNWMKSKGALLRLLDSTKSRHWFPMAGNHDFLTFPGRRYEDRKVGLGFIDVILRHGQIGD